MTLRLRVKPQRGNKVRVSVFVPCNHGHHCAGALDLPESIWRNMIYPMLVAGAARHGVNISLEP